MMHIFVMWHIYDVILTCVCQFYTCKWKVCKSKIGRSKYTRYAHIYLKLITFICKGRVSHKWLHCVAHKSHAHMCVCRDSYICITCLIYMHAMTLHIYIRVSHTHIYKSVTHTYVCYDFYPCVKWLMYMRDMPHVYAHDMTPACICGIPS